METVTRDGAAVDSNPSLSGNQPESSTYFYDVLGRVDRIELPNLVEDCTYTTMGNVLQVAQFIPDGDNTDLTDNLPVAKYDYTYRLDGIRDSAIETFRFDNDDNPETPSVAETTSYAWAYDQAGRLTRESIDSFDDSLDRTETFTLDLVGNRVRHVTDLASTPDIVDQVVTSVYDSNDRLVTELRDDGGNGTIDQTTTYDWGIDVSDPDGGSQQLGVLEKNGDGVTTSRQTMTYNLQGQLAAVVQESFDGSGDVTGRTRVGYQYDFAGIRSVAIEATDTDLNGTFSSTEITGSTEYLTDFQSLTGLPQTLVETTKNAEGETTRRVTYVFGIDELTQTASDLDPSTGDVTSSETLTFGHDAHGSVRALIDATAGITQAYFYTAYGELLAVLNGSGEVVSSDAADALTSLLYSGESFDSRINQQYLRARWYQPGTGRFSSFDPFPGNLDSPFSFNRYAYTSGNPIQFGDPTGNFEGLIGLIGAMAGSSNGRAEDAAASANVWMSARRAQKLIEFVQKMVELSINIQRLAAGDVFGVITSLIGVEPREITSDIERLNFK